MAGSQMRTLIEALQQALEATGSRFGPSDLEQLARVIYRSMGNQARKFHGVSHALGFLPVSDPVMVLAALFHDIVYYQVDEGYPADLEPLLHPWTRFRQGRADLAWPASVSRANAEVTEELKDCVQPGHAPREDLMLANARIFGLQPGTSLAGKPGFNEYWSSLAMFLLLAPHCTFPVLVAVAACIEQTIPFRSETVGDGPIHSLRSRTQLLLTDSGMDPRDAAREAEAMTTRAVAFANMDVRDFGNPDTARFLAGTWKLLPEMNSTLRIQGHCTVREYRTAMVGQFRFFRTLSPERIFHAWPPEDADGTTAALRIRASSNLERACNYMGAKIISVAFLEAACLATGGDLPLSYLMGDIPLPGEENQGLETLLPPPREAGNDPVAQLLSEGRKGGRGFDLDHSPLSAYLYGSIPPGAFPGFLEKCLAFLDRTSSAGTDSPEADARNWLGQYPGTEARTVLSAMATMVPTRRSVLEGLLPS